MGNAASSPSPSPTEGGEAPSGAYGAAYSATRSGLGSGKEKSHRDEEEERKEAPKPKKKSGNVKVFRPNLSAGNRFTEDSRSSATLVEMISRSVSETAMNLTPIP